MDFLKRDKKKQANDQSYVEVLKAACLGGGLLIIAEFVNKIVSVIQAA